MHFNSVRSIALLNFVKHETTLTASLLKPRIISIPRTTFTVSQAVSPASYEQEVSRLSLDTPPDTPAETPAPTIGLGIETAEDGKQEKERRVFDNICSRTTWTMTPPSSSITSP